MGELKRAEAELFVRAIETGRNKPIIVGARQQDGDMVHCVVKLAARMEGGAAIHPIACLNEWVAAAVADHLGIAVPRPYEIIISREFAESIAHAEVRRHALASLGSTFGSEYLGGRGDVGTRQSCFLPPT